MDLTDPQWEFIEPLLPKPERRADGRGRPWRDPREVLNGMLWELRTGAQWADMPPRYPPYQTCHRRFQFWVRSGTMERVPRALAEDLEARGQIHRTGGRCAATVAGGALNGSLRGCGIFVASSPVTSDTTPAFSASCSSVASSSYCGIHEMRSSPLRWKVETQPAFTPVEAPMYGLGKARGTETFDRRKSPEDGDRRAVGGVAAGCISGFRPGRRRLVRMEVTFHRRRTAIVRERRGEPSAALRTRTVMSRRILAA
jgi:transposase